MKKLILTVCNGNIHRSVIAALCIEKALTERNLGEKYEVLSRGVQGTCGTTPTSFPNLMRYEREWSLTRPLLEEIGIEIPEDQTATPVDADVAEKASIILAMEKRVLLDLPNSLANQFPDCALRMRLFSEIAGEVKEIPDCFGQTDPKLYRDAILTIHSTVQTHIETLLRLADMFSAYNNDRSLS